MSPMKSLSDFSKWEGDEEKTEEELQKLKRLKDAQSERNVIRDPQYVGRVTSTILGTGMPKKMRDKQFVKVKLETSLVQNISLVVIITVFENLGHTVFERHERSTFD
jgi:hypothetical protein